MKRAEAEARILEKANEIKEILDVYCPNDDHFSMFITHKSICFNNTYWEHEDDGVLDHATFWEGGEERK